MDIPKNNHFKKRCPWSLTDELAVRYHDEEWGVPVHDDNRHFEFLVLESAQAGLSWMTILRKRKNYRTAYGHFDPVKVARYDTDKLEELLSNEGIVRNRRKIESSINNARCFLIIQEEYGSFDNYIWSYVGNKPVVNRWKSLAEIPAKTPLSDRLSRDLRDRGFKFIGSTIIYSHLQATGIVNDHIVTCFRYEELTKI